MLCRILIGLGGSEESRSALELGLRWAKRHDTQLVGLDIVDNSGRLIRDSGVVIPWPSWRGYGQHSRRIAATD